MTERPPAVAEMRRAFTLLELLTVVAIIAIMVAAGVASVRTGQGAARVKGATRDIFALIRHARSVALVSQKPSVITYSTKRLDDEVCASIEVVTAEIMKDTGPRRAMTLEGESVVVGGDDESAALASDGAGRVDETASADAGGKSVADILFAPISDDVVRGVRLKVVKEGEALAAADVERTKPKISVFSNVDYLLGRYREDKARQASAKAEAELEEAGAPPAAGEDQEPVSFVWETNGRTEPHRVWIYRDGSSPEKGLCIKIDRFGAAKVLGQGEEDE